MKKTKTRIAILLTIILALTTIFSLTNVYAAETTIDATSTTKSLVITRDVKNVTNPVTNKFYYTVTLESGDASAVSDLPAADTLGVTFSGVSPNASTKIATATGSIDLSSIKFTKVGDYTLKIVESKSDDSTTYPVDSTNVYYAKVSVRYETDNNNVPNNNSLVATLASQVYESATDTNTDNKTDLKYESTSEFTYIELTKNVTGNMAETGDYFPFVVTIPGGDVNAKYTVAGTHSTDNGSTEVSSSEILSGDTIYLKHGQTVTIGVKNGSNQITVGSNYTIVETPGTYTATVDGTAGSTASKTAVKTTDTTFNTANKTTFVNNKVTATITGIFVNIIPFIVLLALAVVGIYAIRKTSK